MSFFFCHFSPNQCPKNLQRYLLKLIFFSFKTPSYTLSVQIIHGEVSVSVNNKLELFSPFLIVMNMIHFTVNTLKSGKRKYIGLSSFFWTFFYVTRYNLNFTNFDLGTYFKCEAPWSMNYKSTFILAFSTILSKMLLLTNPRWSFFKFTSCFFIFYMYSKEL